jgi:low affinity Fe/Cu permease
MSEKDLIKLWMSMRTQIIKAQMAPALVLIGIFATSAFGKFDGASDGTKYLAIGVAAVTGILAIISQYAAVREGEAVLEDLAKLSNKSTLGTKISQSRGLLSISATAITGFGIATFALVVWAVLG